MRERAARAEPSNCRPQGERGTQEATGATERKHALRERERITDIRSTQASEGTTASGDRQGPRSSNK